MRHCSGVTDGQNSSVQRLTLPIHANFWSSAFFIIRFLQLIYANLFEPRIERCPIDGAKHWNNDTMYKNPESRRVEEPRHFPVHRIHNYPPTWSPKPRQR